MKENDRTQALEPFDFNHLIDNVPKLKKLDYDIGHYQFANPIDSAAMKPADWIQIAKVIEENYDEFDGFVVLHGTDTMAYTASALSFMLENLDKPVIITGSQLPIGEVRTDGEENLITAIQIAAAKEPDGTKTVREVAILFENNLWRGNRSTKRSADNFDAFRSNNYPELARIGLYITFNKEALWHGNKDHKPLKVNYNLDSSVMVIDLFPGIEERVVRHSLATPGVKGIVLKTFGAGNGPTDPWFYDALREAVENGKVIVNITQCENGGVQPNRYACGLELAQTGVISGHDLTKEAAITKLMYLFGLNLPAEKVKELMEKNLRGEIS